MRRTHVLLFATLLAPNLAAAEDVPTGRLSGSVTPTAYRIDLTVLPQQPRFTGHVEIDVSAKGAEKSLFLHGRKLHVTKASALQAGKTIAVTYREVDPTGVAKLDFARALEPGAVTLTFDYDAAFAAGTAGLYHVKVKDQWYAWTQFEAIDARAAFPCFDQPEWKTPFTISLSTAAEHVAVTNEAQTGSTPAGKLVRHTFAPTAPLPTYLVALAVGPFDVAESTIPPTPQRAKPLPLRIIATAGQKAKLEYALTETKPIIALLEAYFDRPYPWSKLDQIASPVMGGAMENAGAVVYDDNLIVIGDDTPVRTKQRFGMVIAHELAHQWFGDLVTPVWWEDIWLNESFASWLGYRIAGQWRKELNIGSGSLVEGFDAMDQDSLRAGRPIHQPIQASTEIDAAFDGITYGKGGQVISMIEAYLGAEKFQKGVRLHIQRFAGRNAASEDFFRSLADAAGEPRLVAAMRGFVDQQGVPVVHVERSGAQLQLSQSRYAPLGAAAATNVTWTVPLCLRAGDARQCTLFDKSVGSMPLPGRDPSAFLMPNAGGHGYYRFDLPEAEWNTLFKSAQQLPAAEALAALDSVWAQWRAGRAPTPLLLSAARAFAGHADSYVVIDVADRVSELRTRGLLAQAQLPSYRQLVNELFAPRLKKLGVDLKLGAYTAESPDTQRLRNALVRIIREDGYDIALHDKLTQAAASWMDGNEAALDRAFLTDGLAAWIEQNGLAGAKRVWTKLLASGDADIRQRSLMAITSVDDPTIARWALDNIGKGLRSTEKLMLVMSITRAPQTREVGFGWLTKNFIKLAKETNLTSSGVVRAASNFCSAADADRIESSWRPHVKTAGQGSLPLTRVVEDVRNCGAVRAAREAELQNAFVARPNVDHGVGKPL